MDYKNIVMTGCRRHFQRIPPLTAFGYIPKKSERVNRSFDFFGVTLILSGNGNFRYHNKNLAVTGPCLLHQWPGLSCDFGPDPESTWEELYFNWDKAAFHKLQTDGYNLSKNAVQTLHFNPVFQRLLDHFLNLLHQANPLQDADRFDAAALHLLSESLLCQRNDKNKADPAAAAITAIRQHIEAQPLDDHDVLALAAHYDLSPSRFRRHWHKEVGCPPLRYILNLRLRLACRHLVENDDTITDIAKRYRFDDPLYFSRQFRKFTGFSASAYRQQHRNTHEIL